MVSRQRGHTVFEVMLAMGLLVVLAGATLSGGEAHLVRIGHELQDLEASRVASTRLESLDPGAKDFALGKSAFDVPFANGEGHQEIEQTAAGLFHVTVRVRPAAGRPFVTLETLVVREQTR